MKKQKQRQASEFRRSKRLLLRRGGTRDKVQIYADNMGNEFDYKITAKLSSFLNVTMGCFRNGFPVIVPKLWYNAWAFYPFFFVKKGLKVKDPIVVLNHERIHVRQQRDIHLVLSIPIIALCLIAELFALFNPLYLLCSVPFIPTFAYGIEMVRVWRNMLTEGVDGDEVTPITFQSVRENTCFERESIMRGPNANYLLSRKFMAVLAYTGWKRFEKYGMQ